MATIIYLNKAAQHDSRMGIPLATFNALKETLSTYQDKYGAGCWERYYRQLQKANVAGDLMTRLRWDHWHHLRKLIRETYKAQQGIDPAVVLTHEEWVGEGTTGQHIQTALERLIEVGEAE